ncbi:AEC family transporter [Sphingomonas immobilis]|uniref:AEC family transporter n=1 Tax=Sphingomonas immobilis TaxID=3063997 RepID=A0ABT9A1P6_9SPHN|nr:AEC family transporter [Sphingomonas sp. CA1-15]MDO7843377.1 AEC family transporter [Sphingomonas sp. CA1-15]
MTVLSAVLPVFLTIAAGWLFGRIRKIDGGGVALLNAYVVWVALPALLFDFIAEADWAVLGQGRFALVFFGGIAITFLATMLLPARAGDGRGLADRSIQSLAASYANTAYMGIPLLGTLFGAAGTAAAVLASILTVCLIFAFSIALVETDVRRGSGFAATLLRVGAGVLRNPIVLSPLAGLAWNLTGLAMPHAAQSFLKLLGGSATPVALVTIGMFLAIPRPAVPKLPLALTAIAKLALQPLATAALLMLIPLPKPWAAAALLLAALPTGTGPFMVAQLYGRDMALTARTILITTILSVATVSGLAFLLI